MKKYNNLDLKRQDLTLRHYSVEWKRANEGEKWLI